MHQDSIKTLIQCEKEAKDSIENARKERNNLKKQAKVDALEIVKSLRESRENELKKIVNENKEKLKIIEMEIEKEYEEKMKNLDFVLDGKKEILEIVAEKIYK
ncbi:hypothetical protein GVAV_001693 [Gurleya vavrai]